MVFVFCSATTIRFNGGNVSGSWSYVCASYELLIGINSNGIHSERKY